MTAPNNNNNNVSNNNNNTNNTENNDDIPLLIPSWLPSVPRYTTTSTPNTTRVPHTSEDIDRFFQQEYHNLRINNNNNNNNHNNNNSQ